MKENECTQDSPQERTEVTFGGTEVFSEVAAGMLYTGKEKP